MTDQLYIDDDGQIDAQPLTWDGEPVYSPASVQEGLFEALAFEQMPGQTAMSVCGICGASHDSASSWCSEQRS